MPPLLSLSPYWHLKCLLPKFPIFLSPSLCVNQDLPLCLSCVSAEETPGLLSVLLEGSYRSPTVLTETSEDVVWDRGSGPWLGVTRDWRWLVGAGQAVGAPAGPGDQGCEFFSYSFAKSICKSQPGSEAYCRSELDPFGVRKDWGAGMPHVACLLIIMVGLPVWFRSVACCHLS